MGTIGIESSGLGLLKKSERVRVMLRVMVMVMVRVMVRVRVGVTNCLMYRGIVGCSWGDRGFCCHSLGKCERAGGAQGSALNSTQT